MPRVIVIPGLAFTRRRPLKACDLSDAARSERPTPHPVLLPLVEGTLEHATSSPLPAMGRRLQLAGIGLAPMRLRGAGQQFRGWYSCGWAK